MQNEAHFNRLRWLIFGLLATAYMLVFFHRIAPAVLAEDLAKAFNTSAAELGVLGAMYYYIYTAMQIPSGILADRVGPRWCASAGLIVGGIGSIVFAMADSYAIAATGRFLVGLGVSVLFVGFLTSNARWFTARQFATISGLTLLIGQTGAMLATGPLALVLEAVSWRDVFLALGGLSLLLAVLVAIIVRNRPEDAGFTLKDSIPVARSTDPWWRDLQAVLKSRAVLLGFGITFLTFGAQLTFASLWAIPLLQDSFGLSRPAASLYTTLSLGGAAIGTFTQSWLSDRIGRRKPIVVSAVAVTCLLWALVVYAPWTPGWSAAMLFFVMGFVPGGVFLCYAIGKDNVEPNRAGSAIAIVNTGVFMGVALMQPIFGALLDLAVVDGGVRDQAAYHWPLIMMLVSTLGALGLAALLPKEAASAPSM